MRIFRVQVLSAVMLACAVSILTVAAPQKPSPAGTAETTINGKKITINYSRPSMRGRKIVGELVPYNKVWRTGANEATALKTDVDLMFGKVLVPAGSYTLYSWPTDKGWKLIINKQTGQWGTEYDESKDLARIDLKVAKTAAPVEQFTITLTSSGKNGLLKMDWENTSLSTNFTVK